MEPSIIDSLSASERTVFRDYFVTTILATDLAKHAHLMDSFRDLLPEISSCLPLTADSHSLASTKPAMKPSSSDPPPQPSMQRRLSASNCDISFLRPQRKRLAGRRYSVDAAHEMVRPSVEWWGSNDGARRLMACMLMKSADLVGVARSWETARYVAQCYFLEVQSQIPKEIAAGLPPSASEPACKDTHIAKTQLGFIHAIPEPLWQAVSQAVPSLSVFCQNLSSNLAQWTTVLKLLANPACAA